MNTAAWLKMDLLLTLRASGLGCAAVKNANGSMMLTGTGISGYAYVVQFTTNLVPPVLWQSIGTNVASAGQWQFLDNGAAKYQAGFYRIHFQP